MTCAEFNDRLPAWLAGTLSDADAQQLEQHAAECVPCGERLEVASRTELPPRELPPRPSLREVTLGAVAQRRAAARWRKVGAGGAAIAAMALFLLISRPATKSASDFPGAGTELLARARARPEFAALDAAEHDVLEALKQQPADTSLAVDLVRIRRQRDALQRLVAEVRL